MSINFKEPSIISRYAEHGSLKSSKISLFEDESSHSESPELVNAISGHDSYSVEDLPNVRHQSSRKRSTINLNYEQERDISKTKGQTPRKVIDGVRLKLIQSGFYDTLIENLSSIIDVLVTNGDGVPKGAFLDIILKGWVEELLRFLFIKTVLKDTTVPFIITPSRQIDEAWKILMMMPCAYKCVCESLGNEAVIDYDPLSEIYDDNDESRIKNRLMKTHIAYKQSFDDDPPRLFWPPIMNEQYPSAKNGKAASILSYILKLFHCD